MHYVHYGELVFHLIVYLLDFFKQLSFKVLVHIKLIFLDVVNILSTVSFNFKFVEEGKIHPQQGIPQSYVHFNLIELG